MGLSFSPNEKSDLILTIYGKLALWAAITIFPAECLRQGEEGQVQIMRGFVRNFAEYYAAWVKYLSSREDWS